MKKIIILIALITLITGCKAKYDLVINEDLSISEEAMLTGTSDFFKNYYKTTKTNVLKSLVEIYEDTLKENNYTYEIKSADTPYVLVSKTYKEVDDYVNNSKLFNDYFDEVKYTIDGDIRKIETVGYNDNDPDNQERFNIKELEITITCPFKVINHNAKGFDTKTNTYYYELNAENDKILFEYDTSRKFNPNESLIVTIIVALLIVIGAWIAIILLNKNNKKN